RAVLGFGTRPHRQRPHCTSRGCSERTRCCQKSFGRRWQLAESAIRGSRGRERLASAAHITVIAYESAVPGCRRQADAAGTAKRGMVPGIGRSVLESESATDIGQRNRGGKESIRSRARDLQRFTELAI